jgi:plasmid stability protein
MEAEVRDILETAVGREPDFVGAWLAAANELRGDDFEVPARSSAREVDLS